jgi:hypothetical protein
MAYAALSALDDAVDATRALLLPVDRGLWLRLAVVVFFLSGGSGVGSLTNASSQIPVTGTVELPAGVAPMELLEDFLPIVVGVAVLAATVGLAFALVGAVMEFVLVDALSTESVSVRAMFREHVRKGLSLFVFQMLLFLGTAGIIGGVGFLTVWPALDGGGAALAVGILLTALVGFVVGLVAVLTYVLTVSFVVPTMLAEDRGLRAAWGRFWTVLRSNLAEFLVYLAVRIAVMVGVGIAAGAIVGIAAAVLLIPFGLLAGIVFLASGVALSVGAVGSLPLGLLLVFGVLAALYVLVLVAVTAIVQVPLKTFTRYYELLVLGDIEPDLDLVSERRKQLRADPF